MRYQGYSVGPFSVSSVVPAIAPDFVDFVIYEAMNGLNFSYVDILNCRMLQFQALRNIAIEQEKKRKKE